MRHGNIVFPFYPRDLDVGLLDNCPSVLVYDHIRCWNALNENSPGIYVSSPTFSDSCADYGPSKMAPTWYCCSLPTFIHSFGGNDTFNKNYSRFLYLPTNFRMSHWMLQEELSTNTTCSDYVESLRNAEREGHFVAERYVMTKSTPIPDPCKMHTFHNDNYKKVPRTNSALRHFSLFTQISLR